MGHDAQPGGGPVSRSRSKTPCPWVVRILTATVLVADADGAAALPEVIRQRWDDVLWFFETSATTTLARLRSRVQPRLAVISLQMPDQCGADLVERIRKGRPLLPIVVTSHVSSTLPERLARTMGIIAFVPKPIDAVVFDDLLSSILHVPARLAEHAVGTDTVAGE